MPRIRFLQNTKALSAILMPACLIMVLLLTVVKPSHNLSHPPLEAVNTSEYSNEALSPAVIPSNLDTDEVKLGRELFHDPRLSEDNSISCSSCHDLRSAGADKGAISRGIFHQEGTRNSPTVFNSGMNYRQFWDGRAAALEDQVDGPIQSKVEMGTTWSEVLRKLKQDPHYQREFRQVFPGGIEASSVREALAEFERSLVTIDCKFDRYLKGETNLLTNKELAGYRLFNTLGCVSCHQGKNIGGGLMEPFGIMKNRDIQDNNDFTDLWPDREVRNTLYKVPSLRNVGSTAPYFHDGSAKTLPEAVRIMSEAQLYRDLTDSEIDQITSFLNTLTGRYEGRSL